MGTFVRLVVCLLAAALSSSCSRSRPEPGGEGRTFTDVTGCAVQVPSTPRRIVSLVPSITEGLFRLGAGDRVVGVTSFCNRPPRARERETVGSYLQPDLETILSLRPDLVIAGKKGEPGPILRLRGLGAAVYVFEDGKSWEDIRRDFLTLGRLAGEAQRARELLAGVEARLEAVRRRVEDREPVRVFVQIGTRPIFTGGRDTFLDDVIRFAGGRNAAAPYSPDYFQVSRETVLSWNPEAILVSGMAVSAPAEKERWLSFRGLSAADARNVHIISGDDVSRPDPVAFAQAVETVARLLHP